MPMHFYKPPRSTRWYVRLVPPKHVQAAGIKAEYRQSTGHADMRQARAVGARLLAAKESEWAHATRGAEGIAEVVKKALSPELISQICAQRHYSWLQTDEEERSDDHGLSDAQMQEIEEFCNLADRTMRSVVVQGKGTPLWSDVVESALDWCVTIGHGVEAEDPLFISLVREFAKVELAAQQAILRRNQGEPVPTPSPVRGHVLSEVTDAFRDYKAPSVDAKGLGTVLGMWGDFIAHTGDIALNSVRASHVYDFLHARMNAPVRSWSEKRARTFGKSNFREIFGFARTKGLMTESNPVDALETLPRHSRKEENSRKKPRYPFLDDHLSRIFASAWYDPAEGSMVRGKLKVDLGARYWIPLFSMAHGNRVREASQLVASDFRDEGGIFVVSFRVELEDEESASDAEVEGQVRRATDIAELRTLKNDATKRTVPVHPLLISLGFIEFVAGRRREGGGQALLFPSSAPKPGGRSPKLGRAYEQAFLRFVRDRLKFGNGYGNHSFRHQLEDRMREAQKTAAWPPGLTHQYSGRTSTRAVDKRFVEEEGSEGGYGNGYSPGTLLSYTERLDFSKVTLPIPYAEWLAQAGGDSSLGRAQDFRALAL